MRTMKIVIIWHHIVLEETARGISDAFTIMGINHECVYNKSKHIKNDDNIYIIIGIHHFDKLPLNYIIVQTEQPGSNWIKESLFRKFDKSMGLWEFSPKLDSEWKYMGYNSHYVPIRIPMDMFVEYGKKDIHFTSVKKDIDILFYGGIHKRRIEMQKRLKKKFPKKKIVFRYYNLFGEEREGVISRSKVIINMHFWPKSSLETHRIEYLMARGKCVVSENSLDAELDTEYTQAVQFTSYDDMPKTIEKLLQNPKKMKEHEDSARKLSEKHQFNMKHVKEALLGCSKNIIKT